VAGVADVDAHGAYSLIIGRGTGEASEPLLHNELRARLVERAAVFADGQRHLGLESLLRREGSIAGALLGSKPEQERNRERAKSTEREREKMSRLFSP